MPVAACAQGLKRTDRPRLEGAYLGVHLFQALVTIFEIQHARTVISDSRAKGRNGDKKSIACLLSFG